jgi:uncharacterized protein YjiS (DUF1127 family)
MSQTKIMSLPLHRRNGVFQRFVTALVQANERHAQRLMLARLDTHLLRDIGLDANKAAEECAKPFWRP